MKLSKRTRPKDLQHRLAPHRYRPTDLEQMMVQDGIAGVWSGYWLPGAQMVHGQWIVDACVFIGRRRKVNPDRVFEEVEGAIQAATGRGFPL